MTSSSSASEIPESSALPDSPSASYAAYDVFISHRGPETRKTLVSHLYYRLSTSGLRVFVDQFELQRGMRIFPQIKNAIATASVHLAILSPTYAESEWCLDELDFMLQSGARVVPVFYHVKPSELRWIRGRYGYAMQNHVEKGTYDPSTIERWRNALYSVSDLSGFELETFNDDEAILVEKIIEFLLRIVPKSEPIDNRHLPSRHQADEQQRSISLNEKIEEFEHRISWQQQTEKPHIVGIVGFAGVGKTTLAKEFFDRKKGDFKKSLFLSAYKDSLHSLQLKLCKALVNPDIQEDSIKGIESYKENLRALPILSDEGSITEGIRLLQENLQVLLVLDDIDHVDQLVALLPVQNYLSSKSRILIISRKKKVLRRYGIERSSIYKLTGLHKRHSKELFSSRAFDQCDRVPRQFESVVNQFVDACEGSPLLLAMYGALLRGKNDISDWLAQLCWNINSNCRAVAASRNRGLTKESTYSRHRHKCLFTVCLFLFPKQEEDQIWALRHNCSPNSIKEEAWLRRKVPASSQPQHLSVLGFHITDSSSTAECQKIRSVHYERQIAAESLSES